MDGFSSSGYYMWARERTRGAANPGCSRLSRRLRARPSKRILWLQSQTSLTIIGRPPARRLQPGLAAPRNETDTQTSTYKNAQARLSPRLARPAGVEDPLAAAAPARIRHHVRGPGHLRGSAPRRGGLALSGAAPHGGRRVDPRRMDHERHWAASAHL